MKIMIEVLFINILFKLLLILGKEFHLTLVGDTTGTWKKDTSIGMRMRLFSIWYRLSNRYF